MQASRSSRDTLMAAERAEHTAWSGPTGVPTPALSHRDPHPGFPTHLSRALGLWQPRVPLYTLPPPAPELVQRSGAGREGAAVQGPSGARSVTEGLPPAGSCEIPQGTRHGALRVPACVCMRLHVCTPGACVRIGLGLWAQHEGDIQRPRPRGAAPALGLRGGSLDLGTAAPGCPLPLPALPFAPALTHQHRLQRGAGTPQRPMCMARDMGPGLVKGTPESAASRSSWVLPFLMAGLPPGACAQRE